MIEPRISNRSEGTFSAKEWIDEGEGLLASARTTRATWLHKKRTFRRLIKEAEFRQRRARAWDELIGLPRASILLLGYSVEMFLKAGLAKAYHGCREAMFERDVRQRFGHDLFGMAEEIDLPIARSSKADFDTLRHHILAGARYPVMPGKGQTYTDAVNARTSAIWDGATFRRFCELAKSVRKHALRIDNDSENPAIFKSLNIDDDGYLAFRIGGHLRPRITYQPSGLMETASQMSSDDLRRLLDDKRHTVLLHYWDQARIIEDSRAGRTLVRKK